MSVGIILTDKARIVVSKAWGPSQTFFDTASMAPHTMNNFKAWSFGIAYQAPASK